MSDDDSFYIAIALYVLGAANMYTLIPASFPISCAGRSPKRIAAALLWPIFGTVMLVMCLATNFS